MTIHYHFLSDGQDSRLDDRKAASLAMARALQTLTVSYWVDRDRRKIAVAQTSRGARKVFVLEECELPLCPQSPPEGLDVPTGLVVDEPFGTTEPLFHEHALAYSRGRNDLPRLYAAGIAHPDEETYIGGIGVWSWILGASDAAERTRAGLEKLATRDLLHLYIRGCRQDDCRASKREWWGSTDTHVPTRNAVTEEQK